MSNEEHSEYMKNVRWTTAGGVLVGIVSTVIALVWFTSDIKASITHNQVVAHNELMQAVDTITLNDERRDHKYDLQFQALWNEIKQIKPNTVYKMAPKEGLYTQHKDINGNLSFRALK